MSSECNDECRTTVMYLSSFSYHVGDICCWFGFQMLEAEIQKLVVLFCQQSETKSCLIVNSDALHGGHLSIIISMLNTFVKTRKASNFWSFIDVLTSNIVEWPL